MARRWLICMSLVAGITALTVSTAWCLPPIPQPHPKVYIVESSTEYVTLRAKPISCAYTVVITWNLSRYDCGMDKYYEVEPVTRTMVQGTDHTFYWNDMGSPPRPGDWTHVIWRCTMHYPDWEHGPVTFVTMDLDQVPAGPAETSASARLRKYLSVETAR
jgi:hypothetical protein